MQQLACLRYFLSRRLRDSCLISHLKNGKHTDCSPERFFRSSKLNTSCVLANSEYTSLILISLPTAEITGPLKENISLKIYPRQFLRPYVVKPSVFTAIPGHLFLIRETLIKSFLHIAKSDFLSGCTNKPQ